MSIVIASGNISENGMRTKKVIVVYGVVGIVALERTFPTIKAAVAFAADVAKAFGLPTGFSELRCRHCTAVGHEADGYHVKVYKVRG